MDVSHVGPFLEQLATHVCNIFGKKMKKKYGEPLSNRHLSEPSDVDSLRL